MYIKLLPTVYANYKILYINYSEQTCFFSKIWVIFTAFTWFFKLQK